MRLRIRRRDPSGAPVPDSESPRMSSGQLEALSLDEPLPDAEQAAALLKRAPVLGPRNEPRRAPAVHPRGSPPPPGEAAFAARSVTRPRGFEPLTFGSVDRSDRPERAGNSAEPNSSSGWIGTLLANRGPVSGPVLRAAACRWRSGGRYRARRRRLVQLGVADHAAKLALGLQHPGRRPAQAHVAVLSALDVATRARPGPEGARAQPHDHPAPTRPRTALRRLNAAGRIDWSTGVVDGTQLLLLIDAIGPVAGKRGRPRQRPARARDPRNVGEDRLAGPPVRPVDTPASIRSSTTAVSGSARRSASKSSPAARARRRRCGSAGG